MNDEEFLKVLQELYKNLLAVQEPLGGRFTEILEDNKYDLYIEDIKYDTINK